MSSGLTHTGAIARGLAYAPGAVAPRTWRSTAEVLSGMKTARPAPTEQLAAPTGDDALRLFKASSIERIRAETAMIVEAAKRSLAAQNQARADVRPMGGFVDLRV